MVFKGVESATSATIVSAWTAYVVICRYWIDYGILDTTQCFATEVFMWSTQFSMDTYYFGRFDFSRTLLVFFTFIAVIATFYDWFPSLDVLPVPSFLGHPTVPTTPAVATVPTPSSALIRPIHQSSPPSSISTRAITQTSPSPLAYGVESAASATIVSAWIVYVVICCYWIDYSILDASQLRMMLAVRRAERHRRHFPVFSRQWCQLRRERDDAHREENGAPPPPFLGLLPTMVPTSSRAGSMISFVNLTMLQFPSLDVLPMPSFLNHPTVLTTHAAATVPTPSSAFTGANPSILASILHFDWSNYSNLASSFSLRLAIDFLTMEVL
ncbi:hypothetical protein CRG98_011232 [Punica granatum]|uniref:Uncharacterized protein n=1 Tax=Punica granatum TaxID=22663 RepID=A0A2I0KIH4_PUNGR|nr:hypothetical protein CRG98_011232 [Punica granatum]